jgi:hypothetical protein
MGRIGRLSPSSIIIKRNQPTNNHKLPEFSKNLDVHSKEAFVLIFEYLKEMLLVDKTVFKYVDTFTGNAPHLKLDFNALLSLNILSSGNNSLLSMLDRCMTPSGKRMLKNWVQFPLVESSDIIERQNALQCVASHISDSIYTQFEKVFKRLPDLERSCVKIYSKKSKIKEYITVLEGFEEVNVNPKSPQLLFRLYYPNSRIISIRIKIVPKACHLFCPIGRTNRIYLERFTKHLISNLQRNMVLCFSQIWESIRINHYIFWI